MKGIMARKRGIHTLFVDREKSEKSLTSEKAAEAILMMSTLLLAGILLFYILKAFSNYTIIP